MKLILLLCTSFAALAVSNCPSKTGPEEPFGNAYRNAQTVIIPNDLQNGEVNAQFETGPIDACALVPLDAQRITQQVNKTSFEMWTFSAVNLDNINETATLVFYLGSNESFPYLGDSSATAKVSLALTWANGAGDTIGVDAMSGDQGAVNLTTDGRNANATFKSTGASFAPYDPRGVCGKALEARFSQLSVQGLVAGHITSTTSNKDSHFTCSANETQEQSLEVMPHLGWTNLHADASAWTEFNIDSRSSNKKMAFRNSISFHDHVWGDRPIQDSAKYWTRGYARLNITGLTDAGHSSYSIVWFQGEDHDGQIYSSSYVVQAGKPQTVGCEKGVEKDKTELLTVKSNEKTVQLTFRLDFDGSLNVVVQKEVLISKIPDLFGRYAGKVSGKVISGGKSLGVEGVAWLEEGNTTA